jgi:hypothetical protein
MVGPDGEHLRRHHVTNLHADLLTAGPPPRVGGDLSSCAWMSAATSAFTRS